MIANGFGKGAEVALYLDDDGNLVAVPAERAAAYEKKHGLAVAV